MGGGGGQASRGVGYSGVSANLSPVKGSRIRGSLGQVGRADREIRTGGGANNSSVNLALLNQRNKMRALKEDSGRALGKRGQTRMKLPWLALQESGSIGFWNLRGKNRKTKERSSFKNSNETCFGRYFGSPGRQRRSFPRRRNNNSYVRTGGNRFSRKEKLKTPSDILKERFNRAFKRGLANKTEFEDSRTSIFQKMCEHYDNYTRVNKIPDNRRSCPR